MLHKRHVWETGERYTGLGWGHLRERDNFEGLCVNWRIILKWMFEK
jgi:hypothetical protein